MKRLKEYIKTNNICLSGYALGLVVLVICLWIEGCTTGAPALARAADMFANTTVGAEYEALLNHGIYATRTADGWTIKAGALEDDPAIVVRRGNLDMFRRAIAEHP